MRCIAALRCAGIAAIGLSVPLGGRAQAPPTYPLGRDLPAFEAPAAPGDPPPAPAAEPAGVIRLRDALAAALLRSPELEADAWELRAREAAWVQSGAHPNPTVSLEIEDVAGSGEFRGLRAAQTTLQLGQQVELGGKRAARMGLAAAERDLASWDYEMRRIDVLARTADAFVDVLAAQERRRLADEALALARDMQRVARLRLREGLASPAEEIRAEVGVEVAGVEREHTEHELATARQTLAAAWGGEAIRFERAEGDLERLPVLPGTEALARQLEESPGVLRWQAELARRRAARDRERSARVPDLVVGAGPRRLSGPDQTAFVVGIELPLPLWNRNRAALAEAEHRLAKLGAEARAARVNSATELAAARIGLHAAAEEAALLRKRVLPGVDRALAIMRQGYEAGRFAQVEVLEAQRTRIQAREQYLRALTEAHHNALQIERLSGVALEIRP